MDTQLYIGDRKKGCLAERCLPVGEQVCCVFRAKSHGVFFSSRVWCQQISHISCLSKRLCGHLGFPLWFLGRSFDSLKGASSWGVGRNTLEKDLNPTVVLRVENDELLGSQCWVSGDERWTMVLGLRVNLHPAPWEQWCVGAGEESSGVCDPWHLHSGSLAKLHPEKKVPSP